MRILYLAHRVPFPPDKGDKIRSFHTIRYLSQKHSVRLACLAWSAEELEYAEALREYCRSIDVVRLSSTWSRAKSLWHLLSSKPLTLPYFSSRRLHRLIQRRLAREKVDVILTFSSCMAQYTPLDHSARRIIDFADADSDKWMQYAHQVGFPRSLIYRLEGSRLRRYEISLASQYDCCTVISKAEERLFRAYSEEFALETVPNGVDLDYFRGNRGDRHGPSLIFTGVMDYYANVDGVLYFHDQILPHVRRQLPEVTLTVLGGNPTPAIRRLGREKGISVTGYVRDVRPYLNSACVCVVPLRIARGVQNKILEAMAMGVPVVATGRALEGIDAQPGQDILVADDPREFARKTVRLLNDGQLQKNISRSARRLVERKYRWDTCLQNLDRILENLCHNRSNDAIRSREPRLGTLC